MRKYFGTDGVRGKANIFPMTSDFALKLGEAVGHKFRSIGTPPHQIVIGKDTRRSGYMFEAALIAGICSQGVDAILTGVLPTPATSFVTHSLRANAGVVISASHNPYYDNGIKFFDASGQKLPDETEEELEHMIEAGVPLSTEHIGRATRIETATGRYVEFVKTSFDKDLDLRGLKVVIDCANGATYKVAPAAIEELGAVITVINNKPNGININDNCGATAPEGMAEKVREIGADIGISFDGDGDRLIACDSRGQIFDGDHIIGVCAISMKQQNRLVKNTIVATVMSNQGFVKSMNDYGIEVIRSQVGDRYVLECMKANGYNLGGEQSGHIIFSDYISTGDGLVSALQLLKVMIRSGKTLDKLTEGVVFFPQVLKNVLVPKKVPLENMPRTSKLIDDISKELGNDGRVLVRYSGTENKIRVMIEGQNQDFIEQRAQDIVSTFMKELDTVK